MATVMDVAAYILARQGEMTAMKLQKLVYYSQAWSLVWDETELFPSRIEAWANGPVVRELYARHQGLFRVNCFNLPYGDPNGLTTTEAGTVDLVLGFYGHKSAQWLSDLTHLEAPWRNARERAGAQNGAQCTEEITTAEMAEYYSSLTPAADDEATQAVA